MKIDRIICLRGGQPFPVKLPNGDCLDSTMELYSGPQLIETYDYVNTDPSLNWKGRGGIIAECECRWICDRRMDNGKKVLFLYAGDSNRDGQIVKAQDLTLEDRTFASLIPNPTQGNRYVITNILVHSIGTYTDGSQGCISLRKFRDFINCFELGDKGMFVLTRAPAWVQPDTYRIP